MGSLERFRTRYFSSLTNAGIFTGSRSSGYLRSRSKSEGVAQHPQFRTFPNRVPLPLILLQPQWLAEANHESTVLCVFRFAHPLFGAQAKWHTHPLSTTAPSTSLPGIASRIFKKLRHPRSSVLLPAMIRVLHSIHTKQG